MVGANYTPSLEMVKSVRELTEHMRSVDPGIRYVVPHRGSKVKDCPGDAVVKILEKGLLGPMPVKQFMWPGQVKPKPKVIKIPNPKVDGGIRDDVVRAADILHDVLTRL